MGPKLMSLGGHAFEAMGFGFTEIGDALETPWSSLDVAARFDALHWTGPKSDAVTIKGVLFPESYGGDGTLRSLRASAAAGRIMPLVSIDGEIGGLFVLEHVERERSLHTPRGVARKQTYTLKLKRYAAGAGGISVSGLGVAVGFSVGGLSIGGSLSAGGLSVGAGIRL